MLNKYYVDVNKNNGRFSEVEEMKKDFRRINFENPEKNIQTASGPAIEIELNENGNVIGGYMDEGDNNTAIISQTGSGKTRRILVPYLLSCIQAAQPLIIHDPKGEIYGFFYTQLKKNGYDIKVLNFREPMKGDRFNPLQDAARLWKQGKRGRAVEIARSIAKSIYSKIEDKTDLFWTEASMNLFLCYFCIAAELYQPEYVTLSVIYHIHLEGTEQAGLESKMQKYLSQHENELCYELGYPTVSGPNETRRSVYAVFGNGLTRLVLNEDISDMLSCSTFEVEDIAAGEKPVALFLITRDEEPATYSTVVGAIFNLLYTGLVDYAQNFHNRLPKTVHMILEEFGNIAPLENINDMLTASRSRNIRMLIILQSKDQLLISYSKEIANVLIGNVQNLIFLSTSDMELAELISKRCGQVTDPYTHENRRLLTQDQLTHFDKDKGETLLLLGRHYPYITYFPDLSSYKMITPLDEVNIKERKRLQIEYASLKEIMDKQEQGRVDAILAGEDVQTRKQKKVSERRYELFLKNRPVSSALHERINNLITMS